MYMKLKILGRKNAKIFGFFKIFKNFSKISLEKNLGAEIF